MNKNKKLTSIASDAPDLAEPILDEASSKIMKEVFGAVMPGVIKDLPVIKYVKTAGDVYGAFRLHKLTRRAMAFATAIKASELDIDEFSKLDPAMQTMVADIIVTELDNHADDLQSEALGYLFTAYVCGKIERLTFLGVAHEIKNTNPLVFYFNVDAYGYELARDKLEPPDFDYTQHKRGTTINSGPIQYLPASFKTNSTNKLAFSSELYMTNLGEAFFEHVYEPMSKAHMI